MSIQMKMFMTGLLTIALIGCGTYKEVKEEYFPEKQKVDYKKAEAPEDLLEVPPDLTTSTIDQGLAVPDIDPIGSASLTEYSRERKVERVQTDSGVLPVQKDVQFRRDGSARWLVVNGTPGQVWPKVRDFWLQAGFLIKREDPRIGILETDWAENRADIPQDFIRRQIGKLFDGLYSAATRDKYRVRLEKGIEAGTTDVYLTHRGAEEVIEGSTESTIWKPRKSDPELEAEMLRRLAIHFGVDEKKSRTSQFAAVTPREERALLSRERGGNASLSLKEEFPRAWRRTGLALDRVGFTVEDRDRSKGYYYVRYIDPLKDSNANKEKGFLSRLNIFGSSDDAELEKNKYTVALVDRGAETEVQVLNDDGKREQSNTAYRILSLLHEQLK